MPMGLREGLSGSGELRTQEIPKQDCAELPDDSGEMSYQAELPDDSGKRMPKGSQSKEGTEDDNPEKRMEPPVVIPFRCPENCEKEEFERQLMGQQNGMNKLTVDRYLKNRAAYENNGRNTEVGGAAQRRARDMAREDKITELRSQNPELSREDAEKEADEWLKTQAALHDPDQIAGGDPDNVTGLGDSRVNSSIGVQWKDKISTVDEAVRKYIDENNLSAEDCEKIKISVQLIAI